MAWNTFKHPSMQFKIYWGFDTTSYTYRLQLSSLPCPHQLIFVSPNLNNKGVQSFCCTPLLRN